MIYYDKLGRKIDIGDIVACSSHFYKAHVLVAKVYGFGNGTVRFRLYGEPNPNASWGNPLNVRMSTLKEEPKGWTRWTNAPELRLLILKKKVNV